MKRSTFLQTILSAVVALFMGKKTIRANDIVTTGPLPKTVTTCTKGPRIFLNAETGRMKFVELENYEEERKHVQKN